MIQISDLPLINAVLNGGSTILLLLGFYQIRNRRVRSHRRFMISALCLSSLFLISYLVYHYNIGSIRFRGEGAVRVVYFTILLTHTVLAASVPPLALISLVRALQKRFARHRIIARYTFPIWLYVSVTGVVIYLMLYQVYPSG